MLGQPFGANQLTPLSIAAYILLHSKSGSGSTNQELPPELRHGGILQTIFLPSTAEACVCTSDFLRTSDERTPRKPHTDSAHLSSNPSQLTHEMIWNGIGYETYPARKLLIASGVSQHHSS